MTAAPVSTSIEDVVSYYTRSAYGATSSDIEAALSRLDDSAPEVVARKIYKFFGGLTFVTLYFNLETGRDNENSHPRMARVSREYDRLMMARDLSH